MRRRLAILAALLLTGAVAPSAMEDAALGLRLADHARRIGDARMMLTAARIVAASGLREGGTDAWWTHRLQIQI